MSTGSIGVSPLLAFEDTAVLSETNNEGQKENTGGTKRVGFAAMDPEKQRQIARMGGEARAHDVEGLREAGRKGGQERAKDIEGLREAGRKGGEVRGEQLRKGRN